MNITINQNQFDALISWTYNLGVGRLVESSCTWLRNLNQGKHAMVPDGLKMWNKGTVDGKSFTLPGLTKRRQAEAELFMEE